MEARPESSPARGVGGEIRRFLAAADSEGGAEGDGVLYGLIGASVASIVTCYRGD